MPFEDALLPNLRTRTRQLNQDAGSCNSPRYVLVWLQQTLRGHQHPTIEAGLAIANAHNLPLLVYHGLRPDYPHASARLSRFIIGASAAMGRALDQRGIACRQLVQNKPDHGKGMVYHLAEHALCVLVDDHPTFVARAQSDAFAGKGFRPTLAVDATRLVPHLSLDGGLGSTKAFRAAHTPLRDAWKDGVAQGKPAVASSVITDLPEELMQLASLSESELDQLASALPIDQSLGPVEQYPATAAAAQARLDAINEDFVRNYKYQRNNPTMPHGATELSPYLHFGMVAPWEVIARVEASGAPKSYGYKLLDELLTWREWTHYRMVERPELLHYETLPTWARKTLADHAADPRELGGVQDGDLFAQPDTGQWSDPVAALTEVIHGRTPDAVFNASARCWLATGWLHNNLRMYWAKQVIRFMPSPQSAWAACCYINDRLSFDGRDPATYVSMRWAFGEARPGYRDIPIYGTVAPKSHSAILKRTGMKDWITRWSNAETPQIDCSDFAGKAALYGVAAEELQ